MRLIQDGAICCLFFITGGLREFSLGGYSAQLKEIGGLASGRPDFCEQEGTLQLTCQSRLIIGKREFSAKFGVARRATARFAGDL